MIAHWLAVVRQPLTLPLRWIRRLGSPFAGIPDLRLPKRSAISVFETAARLLLRRSSPFSGRSEFYSATCSRAGMPGLENLSEAETTEAEFTSVMTSGWVRLPAEFKHIIERWK